MIPWILPKLILDFDFNTNLFRIYLYFSTTFKYIYAVILKMVCFGWHESMASVVKRGPTRWKNHPRWKYLSTWASSLNFTPENWRIRSLKRDYFNRTCISDHWFSGDILVFRGVEMNMKYLKPQPSPCSLATLLVFVFKTISRANAVSSIEQCLRPFVTPVTVLVG